MGWLRGPAVFYLVIKTLDLELDPDPHWDPDPHKINAEDTTLPPALAQGPG